MIFFATKMSSASIQHIPFGNIYYRYHNSMGDFMILQLD